MGTIGAFVGLIGAGSAVAGLILLIIAAMPAVRTKQPRLPRIAAFLTLAGLVVFIIGLTITPSPTT